MLEQLEIHSKSYIVRWVKVEGGHTISWSIQPNKKSINFGIFKHPGQSNSLTSQQQVLDDGASALQSDPHAEKQKRPTSGQNDSSTAPDELKAKGFIQIQWHGKCEADKVTMGTYAVPLGNGGSYGLVFDNTFSRQVSKTATFVLLTYPSNAPPNLSHHMSIAQAGTSGTGGSPNLVAQASESVDSLQSHLTRQTGSRGTSASRGNSVASRNDNENEYTAYHVGVLQKRRRKRGQGYAKRFFSLDFASCTLSYYYNRSSSALRGAIPLSLAAIAADKRRREISIDSGAEVWHLKASNEKDFDEWTKALQKASNNATGEGDDSAQPTGISKLRSAGPQIVASNQDEDKEWEQVEGLVSRMVGTRDALRRLSSDTGSKRHSHAALGLPGTSSEKNEDYFGSTSSEKRSFWKRKSSAPNTPPLFQRSVASQLAVPTPSTVTSISTDGPMVPTPKQPPLPIHEERDMQQHCSALLNDLDSVISDFSILLANSKRRRVPIPSSAPRPSMDSFSTGEFYDAEDDPNRSQLMKIDRHSEEETQASETGDEFMTDEESESEGGQPNDTSAANFPTKPKSLDPLPIENPPQRRKTISPAKVMPPSLISFLRKNVGKDLSTITMPVSANEPTSLLQRIAEQLEYAPLLDTAAAHKVPTHRLLNVAAFAISQFSAQRAKERSIRKPFNPLLGETYELIRSDKEVPGGFRLLFEKISHSPVRIAMQADSANWSFSQSPAPSQKFWGKSVELNTDGRIRVALRLPEGSDELYSWNIATVFLRNVVMGEKYVEPVGNMTVVNETTGAKATIEFKHKGIFSGRSEDIRIESYDSEGVHTGIGLAGNWTSSLRIIEAGKAAGKEIWHVGDLVDDAAHRYGLTTFAAGLNEITEIEKGKLPPTDSRLRVDQRAAEEGDLDTAEEWKVKLEENQRIRRKEMEARGETHKPKWFVKMEGGDDEEEVWKLRGGKDGYWEERAQGAWSGIEDILAG